ncbi:MAG TPA: zf-HC2 domain-containing protein [Bryobacteraceae bacterium]|jgi:hypothetical protein|nr:zf-HC2 domain-containing protein [Bryobacteraceae bacterium]
MNHDNAIASQYPERYAYGELRAEERDAFEEHLADCSRCLQDVTAAEAFAANVRVVFREQVAVQETKEQQRGWFGWLPVRQALAFSGGLNVALAVAAVYAFVAILPGLREKVQRLETPSVTNSFVVAGTARGALPTYDSAAAAPGSGSRDSAPLYTVAKNSFAHFRIDIPKHFEHYQCQIKNQATGERKTYNLPRDDDAETLDLTVPVADLEPGDYKVQVSGSVAAHSEVLASFILRVTSGR